MEKEKLFYFSPYERLITHIKIIDAKKRTDSKIFSSEYMLYTFKVICPFNSWSISKRYSEMKEFYDYLLKIKPNIKFPPFPPKRFFSTKESTIIERRNSFEEIFSFVLQHIDILKYKKLREFFKIKKNTLAIYIKNCILINENKVSYDLIDEESSSSSLECSSGDSRGSNKDKENDKNKDFDSSKNNNNENNIINDNHININTSEYITKHSVYKNYIDTKCYFKVYEDFKFQLGNFTKRSQVSFYIITEFLRNLKVHSSHIIEIINDFTDYLKLKNKWKKFNDNEIMYIFLGMNKGDLRDEYFQYIFTEKKDSNKTMNMSLSDKSTKTSTIQSISNININNLNNSNISSFNTKNAFKDIFDDQHLEGLFYYIGNFEENYLGAKSCLNLLNKIFERRFNPEIDKYITLFKKIDIKNIKKMNLCKFAVMNNCVNQQLCHNILRVYVDGLDEDNIVKILTELDADIKFIDNFLEIYYLDENNNNAYNLE